jgi:signal transduction histidine kinase
MNPVLAPPLFTLCTSAAMAAYVLARRHKDAFHWMLSGFLVGLAVWTTGVLGRFLADDPVQLAIALKVVFVGVVAATSFWLLTALAYVEASGSGPRVHATVVVLSVAALFAMALFTNDGHRLLMRHIDFASLREGPKAWVGPLFWVLIAWSYACVAYGTFLYLRAARRMLSAESRRRGALLAFSALLPAASSTVYIFQIAPVPYDLTPIGLSVSTILLWRAVFRYRLFESLPLAREAVIAHLDDGVVMAGSHGRILHWNLAAARIFAETGIREWEPIDDAIARLLPSRDPNLAAGAGQKDGALSGSERTPDGRLLELTRVEVEAEHGEAAGAFAIIADRTEADRMEHLARQTQRLEIVGMLAAELSREIDEPLDRMRVDLLEIERLAAKLDEGCDPADLPLAGELEDLREVAVETLEGVERIRRIAEGMRELSTVEQSGFATVDLVAVAHDAMRLARLEVGSLHPDVRAQLSPVPTVLGNADRLVQVVLNLLVNARQALADVEAPCLSIETRAAGGLVELHVRDNGRGIPDSLRHRIFDPFFTTRGPDEGTGLGLAIAFDIAREHDGVVEERSGSEGGAWFVLRIPEVGRAGAGRAR